MALERCFLIAAAGYLIACGGGSSGVVTARPSAPAAAALPANSTKTAPPPRAQDAEVCRFTVKHAAVPNIKVPIEGSRLEFDLSDASVIVNLNGEGAATLEVRSPIRFRTQSNIGALQIRLKESVALHAGQLIVPRGARLSWGKVQGGQIEASLEAYLSLKMHPKPSVSCSALTLADLSNYRYDSPQRTPLGPLRRVGLGPGKVPVSASAGQAPSLSVEYSGPFDLIAESPSWVRVRAQWQDGAKLSGWVPKRFVRAEFKSPTTQGDGRTSGGACGSAHRPRPIRLRAGAPIAAYPEGPIWAHVRTERGVDGQGIVGDMWVAVKSLSGLSQSTCDSQLWVRTEDLE